MLLNIKQKQVLDNVLNKSYRDIALYGSGRSGKTFLECYFVIIRALKFPGSYQLFIRNTFTNLIGGVFSQTFPSVLKKWYKETQQDLIILNIVKFYHSPASLKFKNGSEIRFLGLDTESTNSAATDKILSTEYLTIIFEEAPEIPFEVIEKAKTRLAQKIINKQGKEVIPKAIYSYNPPPTYDSWDYKYFFDHINPRSKEPLSEKTIKQSTSVHFHINDNLENISQDYIDTLNNLSPIQRKRFLDGEYQESFESEIFINLNWEELPDINEFDQILIYTDPSYKSGSKNDYKATVAIGKRSGAFWIITGEAMQCTTSQMILNVHNVYFEIVNKKWTKPIYCWFENAGVPDDFFEVIQNHAEQTGWTCLFKMDNRQKGDKFARIESALVPLNEQQKLFINKDLKSTHFGNLLNSQFLNFKKNMQSTDHDDIPDAIHGGITIMNVPVIIPGGVSKISRLPKYTF